MIMHKPALLAILALAACGGSESETADGTADLRFSVTNGVRGSSALVDPLVGNVYGNIYLADEVTLTGPIEGAMEFGYVEMVNVDLRTATESSAMSIGALPEGEYIFLGFYDVDGNGATTKDPDAGDPVTLPVDKFEVVPSMKSDVVVDFDLVYN
jgi:hypothetical protein